MIDIVITRTFGGTVYARRIRTETERSRGISYPEIRWADLEELDERPKCGEVISISERDYDDCERLRKAAAVIAADNITDNQIRELGVAADRRLRALIKVAMNDAPTYLRASVVRDARRRLAELLNARAASKAGESRGPQWWRLARTDDGILCVESISDATLTRANQIPPPPWAFGGDVPKRIARQLKDDDCPGQVVNVLCRALYALGYAR